MFAKFKGKDFLQILSRLPLAAALAGALLLTGCFDDIEQGPVQAAPVQQTSAPQGALEIIGNYSDNFGGTHQVAQTGWVSGSFGFQIITYSNASDFLIAQNDSTNAFDPDKFSRFSWTTFQSSLYYCQRPFNAETFEAANTAPAPDTTDPSTGGCGGFSWTQLTPL